MANSFWFVPMRRKRHPTSFKQNKVFIVLFRYITKFVLDMAEKIEGERTKQKWKQTTIDSPTTAWRSNWPCIWNFGYDDAGFKIDTYNTMYAYAICIYHRLTWLYQFENSQMSSFCAIWPRPPTRSRYFVCWVPIVCA